MNRKINKNFLIIGAMILATVLAFLLISIFSKNNPSINPGVVSEAALKKEILQLESNLLELELVFAEKDIQVDNFETLLDEKYVELDNMNKKVRSMEDKIDQLEREGKVDKATIASMREKIANAKGEIVKNLKAEINLLVFDLGTLTQRGDSLKEETDSLKKSIDDCQTYSNSLVAAASTSPGRSVDTEIPQPPVETRASGFYANNIKVGFLNAKSKAFNARKPKSIAKISKIEFSFDFEGVGEVSNGDKRLFIVLRHKKGNTVVRKGYGDSGQKFSFNGTSLTSTKQVLANYTGRTQKAFFTFDVGDALSDAPGGDYTVSVYWNKSGADVKKIGETKTFING